MRKGFVFGALVMLFVAIMTSVEVVTATGADESELLISIKGKHSAFLSPNFKKVVYTTFSDKTELSELWIMNCDGSDLKKIGELAGYGTAIDWSKDGKKVLCGARPSTERKEPGDSTLWIMNVDGSEKKRVAESVTTRTEYRLFLAILSPDGSKIVYDGLGMCVANTDGSGSKLIRAGLPLSWTLDGKKVIFTDYNRGIYGRGIKEIDIESGVEKMLNATLLTFPYFGFAVSPDGSKIAYIGSEAYRGDTSKYGIWISDIDGSNPRQLTTYEGPFSWSPDSKRIAFISMEVGIRRGIWVMDSDGSNQEKVGSYDDMRGIAPLFQGWKAIIWNKDGNKIAYATYDKNLRAPDIYNTYDIYTIHVGKPSLVKPPAGETPTGKQPGIPGFEAVFAITGLLAVAYLLRRR